MTGNGQEIIPQTEIRPNYGLLKNTLVNGVFNDARLDAGAETEEERHKAKFRQLAAIKSHPGLLTAASVIGVLNNMLAGKDDFDTLQVMLSVRPDLSEAALNRAKQGMQSSSRDVREAAQMALIAVANNASLDLIPEVVESAKAATQDKDSYVRTFGVENLWLCVDRQPGVAETVLPSVELATKDSGTDVAGQPHVRVMAQTALGYIARDRHDLADTILPSVKIGLNDVNDNVRGSAQIALGEIARGRPELGETAFELARKGASDASGTDTRSGAMYALAGIVAARPDVGEKVLELANKGATDSDPGVRFAAMKALGGVVSARPDLGEQVLECAKKGAVDSDKDVRLMAQDALTYIVRARHDLSEGVLPVARKAAESDPDEHVRISAQRDTLDAIRQYRPDLLSKTSESGQAVSAKQESRPLQRLVIAP